MVEIGAELLDPGQGVADLLGELGLAGDARSWAWSQTSSASSIGLAWACRSCARSLG
jgi:hypothetical protein